MHRTTTNQQPAKLSYRTAESECEESAFGQEELAEIEDYYRRLHVVIIDCIRNDEFRLAWKIIAGEERMTHSTRTHAEQAGLAWLCALKAKFDAMGFIVKQNQTKTAWRIRFFFPQL
jgi:hypothetical protein